MFIVVAYDIPDDRRRTRLFKRLKGFGTPVQYSVFGMPRQRAATEKPCRPWCARQIHTKHDTVRYYSLCESCRRRSSR